jgi:uncharacterized RDD family membrane protein YckC
MQNPPPPPPPPGGPPSQYMPPPAPLGAPIAGYPVPAFAAGKTYGGFWMRLVARIVDGIIIGIPLSVIFGVFVVLVGGIASTATNTTDQNAQAAVGLGLVGVWLLIAILATIGTVAYFVYFWGTSGSTLGMRLFKLRIVDADTGLNIGIPRAIVRYLMSIVNSLACYIGWIWIAFDARKQGWHDKVANSVVLQG